MKIISLMDNHSKDDKVKTEHGLSLYIEWKDKKILFDTGASNKFLHNANALGINISDIDACVISHGHDDHGGGISAFIRHNSKAAVYVQKEAFQPYLYAEDGGVEYIGLDQELRNHPRIIRCEGQTEIFPGCTIFDGVVERRFFPPANKKMLQFIPDGDSREGTAIPDEFVHEQYLVLEEDGKTVLFGGCCHNGIVNVRRKALGIGYRLDAIVSGFHFLDMNIDKSAALVDLISNELKKRPEIIYYTCHCTGRRIYEHMKEDMGEQIQYLACGESIEF